MRCDRLREVLFDHLDGLLGAEEAEGARSHLAACAECRRLQEEVRRNFGAMDAWEDEDLPTGAWDRLRARVEAGPPAAPAPSVPRRRWLRVALPFAAGIATAAAAVVVFVIPRGATSPEPPVPAVGAPPAATASRGLAPAAAPVAPAPVASERARPPLRPGETPLRFDDPDGGVIRFEDIDNGVIRTIRLQDVDPRKVMLVDAATEPVPVEGVK